MYHICNTYACQIWLPSTHLFKEMARDQNQRQNLAKAATKDTLETTHLKMLKWVLGVHKKTNNNFCYGDTGRMPWALSVLPQCLRYYERVSQSSSDTNSVNFLVHQSFQEQKNLNLSWYEKWSSVARSESGAIQLAQDRHDRAAEATIPANDRSPMTSNFISDWKADLASQRKMRFYHQLNDEWGEEQYLNVHSSQSRMHIAKIRSSSHDLWIERGRYTNETGAWPRACRFCCDKDYVQGLESLPFFEGTIIEDEEHCLTECPMYHSARSSLSENLKSLLLLKECKVIMTSAHIHEFGKFLSSCHRIRNPGKATTPSVWINFIPSGQLE